MSRTEILRESRALQALGRELETLVRANLLVELGTSLDGAREEVKATHPHWGTVRVEREIQQILSALLRPLGRRTANGHSGNGGPAQGVFAFPR